MMWTCAQAARATNTDYHQLYRWIREGRIKGAIKCKKTGQWWVPTSVFAKPANLDAYVPIQHLKRINYRPVTEAFLALRRKRKELKKRSEQCTR